MALNAKLVSEHRDSRAFKTSTASVARGARRAPAADRAYAAPSTDRFPLRTRLVIILGGVVISWGAVIGLVMLVVG